MLDHEIAALFDGGRAHLGRFTALLAERWGDRPAVEDPSPSPGLHAGGVRTQVDMEFGVARFAAALRAAGVAAGDRVLVLVGNRVDVLLHACAVGRLGGVAAPVNPRLRAGELAAVIDAVGARWLVADPEVAERLRDDLSGRVGFVLTSGDDSVESWLAAHPDDLVEGPTDLDPSAVALYLTTSGTTGVPKAAALTSQGLLQGPSKVGRVPGFVREGRCTLATLPLAHVMGFANLLGMLCGGVLLVHRARFDPVETLDLIEQRRPDMYYAVPTMFADLEAAGAADRDLSSIHLFGSGADVMPVERARRFQSYGSAMTLKGRPVGKATFIDSYGMVELSGAGAVRLHPPGPSRFHLPSVAAVLPGLEARAVDEEGQPVRRGRVGELQFRGTIVLEHYEGHPDAGPATDGWFSSGDHARLWPGGRFFTFAGRQKDRLKVGGFSVFPAEVEADLEKHPDVAEVALVGLPDERLGERPVALVVPRGPGFDPEAFLGWAKDAVAGYRCPREVHVVDAIPRGNNAKVDRAAATALGERIAAG